MANLDALPPDPVLCPVHMASTNSAMMVYCRDWVLQSKIRHISLCSKRAKDVTVI